MVNSPESWGIVGYWGTNPPNSRLNQQLRRLVEILWPHSLSSKSSECNCCDDETNGEVTWGIATLNKYAKQTIVDIQQGVINDEENVIATFSAAGLGHTPDIWISVGAEGSLTWERNVFGRGSLYWIQQESVVWYASQLQYLLPLVDDREINLAALYGYACFSYVPTPLTPIQGIQAVVAGVRQQHCWQPDGTLITQTLQLNHWQVSFSLLKEEFVAVEQLQRLLKQSVLRQLESIPSEPVGVFLSGGLDSSVVAALLVQAGVSVRAYSLDFGHRKTSELPYARRVAEFLGIPLTIVKAGPREIEGAIAATAQALDMPFGDSVTIPLFLLNQAAAVDTSVIFNGENGDQLFAGWTNKPLIAAGLYNLVTSTEPETFEQQYLRTFHRLYGYEPQTFTPAVQSAIAQLDPLQWLESSLGDENEPLLHRLRRATLLLKGAQNIQPRATQLALAHGLRVRSPFCDPELTRWAFGVSDQLYLQGTCEKYILKQAVADWLPEDIVWREKRGMGVPLTVWCFNQLWSDLGRWLNPADLRHEGIWQSQLPKQLVSGQLGNIRGRRIGEALWLLVMWQQWRQQILGESPQGWAMDHPFWLPQWLWQTFRRQSKDD